MSICLLHGRWVLNHERHLGSHTYGAEMSSVFFHSLSGLHSAQCTRSPPWSEERTSPRQGVVHSSGHPERGRTAHYGVYKRDQLLCPITEPARYPSGGQTYRRETVLPAKLVHMRRGKDPERLQHTGHRCRVGRDTRVTDAEWDGAICKWGRAASRSAGPPRGPHGTLTEGWGVQQLALDFHSMCTVNQLHSNTKNNYILLKKKID